MSLPIIMIHRGYASYLITTLTQVKASNPKSDIILLGDTSNQFLNFIRHENLDNYYDEAQRFEQVYADKHMSHNSYSYELLCFQRWFIIKKFMKINKIEKCVYLDSDIMVYTNLSDEQKKYEKFEYVFPIFSSFIKFEGIEKICNHLIDFYTDKSLFEILKSLREQKLRQAKEQNIDRGKVSGISDMTLLTLFRQRNSDKVGAVPNDKVGPAPTKVSSECDVIDSMYDTNINASNGFEMRNGIKRVYWMDRQPFCRHLELDKKIKFNSLHFQGVAKKYIHDYFTGNQAQVFYFRVKSIFVR